MTRCSYFCVPRDLAMAVTARKLWWRFLCVRRLLVQQQVKEEKQRRERALLSEVGKQLHLKQEREGFCFLTFSHFFNILVIPTLALVYLLNLRHAHITPPVCGITRTFVTSLLPAKFLRCLGERWSLFCTPHHDAIHAHLPFLCSVKNLKTAQQLFYVSTSCRVYVHALY